MVDLRSRLFRLPYGDQALFVRRDLFDKLGGFSDQPIMEDYTFVRKARKHGRTVIAGAAVVTSSRRWQRLGIWKTTLLNQRMLLGYHLGTPLEKLANQYCNAR
jgi:GT2 family glycosyltransferase